MPSSKAASSEKERISGKIRGIFDSCQEESNSITKSVGKFRSLWDSVTGDDPTCPNADFFFARFIFDLQLPLTMSEKSPYVDRILEVR